MTLDGVLRLLRPPNVFTAIADSMAGLLIARAAGAAIPDSAVVLLASSAALYLGGIVLNDVFDHRIDAVERPSRPIPSGAVSLGAAIALGVGFLALGLFSAFWVGYTSGLVACALAVAIVGYDGLLKNSLFGPWSMGSCRALNVVLGLSPGIALIGCGSLVMLAAPATLGLYIVALTYIARDEVQGNSARRARRGLIAMAVLASAVALGAAVGSMGGRAPMATWLWLLPLLVMGVRNWSPLWRRQDGPTTGRAIGGGIVLIPFIDAMFCAAAGEPLWAIAVASMIVPAGILKRFYSPT